MLAGNGYYTRRAGKKPKGGGADCGRSKDKQAGPAGRRIRFIIWAGPHSRKGRVPGRRNGREQAKRRTGTLTGISKELPGYINCLDGP